MRAALRDPEQTFGLHLRRVETEVINVYCHKPLGLPSPIFFDELRLPGPYWKCVLRGTSLPRSRSCREGLEFLTWKHEVR